MAKDLAPVPIMSIQNALVDNASLTVKSYSDHVTFIDEGPRLPLRLSPVRSVYGGRVRVVAVRQVAVLLRLVPQKHGQGDDYRKDTKTAKQGRNAPPVKIHQITHCEHRDSTAARAQ